jgi:hypothetical protein
MAKTPADPAERISGSARLSRAGDVVEDEAGRQA